MSPTLAAAIHAELIPYDPFGGPAYGKKEMPFIIGPAVATAATAIGTAAAVGTAAAIGSAAVATVGAIAAVATVAGLAMTVVGALTGNSDLMKIGGIVGLAGGVTSLATGVIGAATSAASTSLSSAATPAANMSAPAGASGGISAGATNAAANAITPAFSSGVSVAAPVTGTGMNAATASLSAPTGLLGSAGSTALQSVAPAMQSASTGLGSSVGSGVGAGLSASAPVTQSASFFDALMTPQSIIEIGKVGAGMLQGSAEEDQLSELVDKKYSVENAKLDFEKQKYNTQQTNANTQARMNISARPLTQAELDAAAQRKAESAKKTAQILTAPAGTGLLSTTKN